MSRTSRFAPILLLDEIEYMFSRSARDKGRAMFCQGRVDLVRQTAKGWLGTVRDRRPLEVEVVGDEEDEGAPGACSCESGSRGLPCEHQWALALEVCLIDTAVEAWGEDRDVFRFRHGKVCGWRRPADRKRGLPDFLRTLDEMEAEWMETDGDGYEFEEGFHDEDEPTEAARARLAAAVGAAAKRGLRLVGPARDAPPKPEWQQRLSGLPSPPEHRQLPWPEGAADRVEVLWLLDKSRARGDLTISGMVRKRTRTGRMGSWKWLERGEADVELLGEADFSVFALLCNLQDAQGWGWRLPWGTFAVPSELANGFLTRLAETGRLHMWERDLRRDPPSELAPPLRLADAPCEVSVRHTRDPSGEQAVISVALRWKGEALDPSRLEATFPGFFVIGEDLVPLADPRAWQVCEATDWGRAPLSAPIGDEASLVGELCRLLRGCDWESEHVLERTVQPRPLLRIRAPSPPRAQMQEAELLFEMDGVVVHGADARDLVPVDGALLRRDPAAERKLLQQLLDAGCMPPAEQTMETCVLVPRARLLEVVLPLLNHDWKVEVEGLRIRSPGVPQVRVSSGVDWFDVHAHADFEGMKVTLPSLLKKAAAGDRFVRLHDGSLGMLPEDWLKRWQGLLTMAEKQGDALRVLASQAWTIDLMLAESAPDKVELDRAFEERRAKLRAFTRLEPKEPPRGFRGRLRAYQKEGLGWLQFLQEFGLGGCLADDMGLGKTVQVLAMLVGRKRSAKGRPSLVVAPRSLVFHWQEEAARFSPSLEVLDHTGSGRWQGRRQGAGAFKGIDVVLTTYGTMRRDAAQLAKVDFDYVVLDESQAIKNPRSQVSKAARLLKAEHRLALSGTPVENHLDELWSLFEFLNPGMLGRAKAFKTLVGGKGASTGDALRLALRPFLLRRTKERVLTELPEKSEQLLRCDLEGPQKKDYSGLRDRFRAELLGKVDAEGLDSVRFEVLTALLRLRQTACHPGLIDPDRTGESCAKLEVLLPMLEEVVEGGHKALVFSQFTSFLSIVRARLEEAGIPFAYLDGQSRDRKQQVDRFQQDTGCPLFLISLKAGGFGLNLTAADYVFLLDPWWNPAVESQAVDRAHRIGQTRKVMAYRIIAKDTIEEKVLELQASKRALAESLFADEGGAGLRELTREDLERLLG